MSSRRAFLKSTAPGWHVHRVFPRFWIVPHGRPWATRRPNPGCRPAHGGQRWDQYRRAVHRRRLWRDIADVLRLPTKDLLRIDDVLALHPAMDAMAKLLERGRLTIIQGVGYPNPNRSHFQSMAYWHTARFDPRTDGSRPDLGGISDLGGWAARSTAGPRRTTRCRPLVFIGLQSPPLAVARGTAPPRRHSTASTSWLSHRPSTRRSSGTVDRRWVTWMLLSGAAWSTLTPWATCWRCRPRETL